MTGCDPQPCQEKYALFATTLKENDIPEISGLRSFAAPEPRTLGNGRSLPSELIPML